MKVPSIKSSLLLHLESKSPHGRRDTPEAGQSFSLCSAGIPQESQPHARSAQLETSRDCFSPNVYTQECF